MKLSDFKLFDTINKEETLSDEFATLNNTDQDYARDRLIHELIYDQTQKYPQRIAVASENGKYTFNELEERSNRIAHYLSQYITEPGQIVAIMMNQTEDLIAHLLGILKANAAYMPIDPGYPEQRINFMIEDAQAIVLLTNADYLKRAEGLLWTCTSLRSVLCADQENISTIYNENGSLMKTELWDFIGTSATDEISLGGWESSFTGEPLSEKEMEEFGENIEIKLEPYLSNDTRVLEIGCASGYSLFKLAPKAGYYLATDLSPKIVERTARNVKERQLSNVDVLCMPAHQVKDLKTEKFDVIVLNSVVQNFNGYDYLREVIRQCLDVIKDDGIIFLGDLMDLDKKEVMISELMKFAEENQGKGFRTKTKWGEELFVPRNFTDDLMNEFSVIRQVSHSEKRGSIKNELVRFRYDTILRISNSSDSGESMRNDVHRKKHLDGYEALQEQKSTPLNSTGDAEQSAYVIYTSGSSGEPKGAIISHRSVINLVCGLKKEVYDLYEDHVNVALLASVVFDASAQQIFASLIEGHSLFLVSPTAKRDSNKLDSFIREHEINIMDATPSLLNLILEGRTDVLCDNNLKHIIIGGENFTGELADRFYDSPERRNIRFTNVYGLTECTVDSTAFTFGHGEYDAQASIPIGRPMANVKVYILDDQLKILPMRFPGKLFIAGDGLAISYLNRPELTTERFIPNPFIPGAIMYDTGDKGRLLSDQTIQFMGRADGQVKIRGYRIELDEIARKLEKHHGLNRAYVLAEEFRKGQLSLAAYFTSQVEQDQDELRSYLAESVPDYMVPEFWIQIEHFPLNTSGKIDRKSLPSPNLTEHHLSGDNRVLGTGPAAAIRRIWEEVLERKNIGSEDNFFEIGGHSLLAVRVISRIQKELELEVGLGDIFNTNSLQTFTDLIVGGSTQEFEPIPVTEIQDDYPLSFAQMNLWEAFRMQGLNHAYNMPVAYRFSGNVKPRLLERALRRLVVRHEVLRTIFIENDGEPRQKVLDAREVYLALEEVDVSSANDPEAEVKKAISTDVGTPFSIDQWPLIRVKLFHLGNEEHVFYFVIHHIVADGWSMQLIFREILATYHAFIEGLAYPYENLRIQYKDFAAWQEDQITKDVLDKDAAYWLNRFSTELPHSPLPIDKPWPEKLSSDGDQVHFEMDADFLKASTAIAEAHQTSLYVLFLAMYKAFLYRISEEEQIIVATPAAGRNHIDLEEQLGLYLNVLAIKSNVISDESFSQFVDRVKSNVNEGLSHQTYPFQKLAEKVNPDRSKGQGRLFDVGFTWVAKFDSGNMYSGGLSFETFEYDYRASKTAFWFFVSPSNDGIKMHIEYNTGLFTRETILILSEKLKKIMQEIISNPDQNLGEINLLLEDEKKLAENIDGLDFAF